MSRYAGGEVLYLVVSELILLNSTLYHLRVVRRQFMLRLSHYSRRPPAHHTGCRHRHIQGLKGVKLSSHYADKLEKPACQTVFRRDADMDSAY